MSYTIQKDWKTYDGLRAVVLLIKGSHRCGYVEVPKDHPLHGVDYMQETDALEPVGDDEPIGKRGPLLALTAGSADGYSIRVSPDVVFYVHGGITFAGDGEGYLPDSDGWWFGFDCAHAGDGSLNPRAYSDGPVRDAQYVAGECESLAEQIVQKTK